MDYSFLISGMTWSYSRIKTFTDCPYKFLLRYIYCVPEEAKFFSSYGSFVHSILEKFHNNEIDKRSLVGYYLLHFNSEVSGRPPSDSIFKNYFESGINYFKNLEHTKDEILGVEKKVEWNIRGYNFTGYIDLITRDKDGDVKIIDNKSRDLKNRSKRFMNGGKPTQTDIMLDDYLRQLYLYADGIKSTTGTKVSALEFNCFRTGAVITEPYMNSAAKQSLDWAIDSIEKIKKESEWAPNFNEWSCEHICGVNNDCEYYQVLGGGRRERLRH